MIGDMNDLVVKLIKDLYTFHEYKISKEKAYYIAELILEIGVKSPDQIESFFKNIKLGKYGQFFNSPTCLTSMYYHRNKGHNIPIF